MYKNHIICVVVPAHNEETQIGHVIDTMPEFVDNIVIVDDASSDRTAAVVTQRQQYRPGIVLLRNERNLGCGGSLAAGFMWCRSQKVDIVVRMDGDGQMDPANLSSLLDPVAEGVTDYAKGNRFFSGTAYQKMPKIRYLGNAFLSLLSKIASGYWHVADFQSGFTAMNRNVLERIDWNKMYKRYGQPNDLLVRLNVHNFRVRDVPIEPVYNVGEKSGMKISRVVFTISWLLLKMFLWRMKEKYVIRDFHPLVFFYFFGFIFGILSIILFGRMFVYWMVFDHIPRINALAAMFSFMSTSQFTLFGMWFDMEVNKELK